jgi:hypothetical protein
LIEKRILRHEVEEKFLLDMWQPRKKFEDEMNSKAKTKIIATEISAITVFYIYAFV